MSTPAPTTAGSVALPTTAELATLRTELLRLRAENEADLRRAHGALDNLSSNGLLDDPSLREEGSNAEYLLGDATTNISKIDAALERMERGTFGICASCQQPIPLRRLQVRPYQPTCVACSA
jgi:DnaK suppressor protein